MRAHSLLLLTLVASLSAAGPDWPHYGGGPDQMRYSPLDADHARERRQRSSPRGPTTPATLSGLRDAVPARRRARRALRHVAQTARVRARCRDRRAEVELRPEPGREDTHADAHPRPDGTGSAGMPGASTSARGTGCTRSTRAPASPFRALARTGGSICARALPDATRARSASA